MKYRVGDSGKIGCVIRGISETGSYLDVTISLPHNPTHTVTIEAGDLLDYTPRAIQVGDIVTLKSNSAMIYRVVAIDGNAAFLRMTTADRPGWSYLSDLTPTDPPPC